MSKFLLKEIEDTYYTLGQAAKETQHSAVTIWRWIKAGKLEAHRIGREVLIERSALERLKKERAK